MLKNERSGGGRTLARTTACPHCRPSSQESTLYRHEDLSLKSADHNPQTVHPSGQLLWGKERGEAVLRVSGEALPRFVSLSSPWNRQAGQMDGWAPEMERWENKGSAALWIRASLSGTTSKAAMGENLSTG